jgi:GNAT superfamily N-acetyltransferase
MNIDYLADHPELVSILGRWLLDEWGHLLSDPTPEGAVRQYREWCRKDGLPLSLVAFDEGEPIGMASLRFHEMETRPRLEHWLASVYVVPERRGNGVGSALVAAAEEAARTFGVERLHLFTPDKAAFYTRLGWSLVEVVPYKGQPVRIMKKELRRE